jgi:hypothetical protein
MSEIHQPAGPRGKYIITITADPPLPPHQLLDWLLDLEVKDHLQRTLTMLLGTREATASARVQIEDADD